MTVKELIEILNKVENKDKLVVMSRDPEGNGYSPMYCIDENCSYDDGEIGLETLTDELKAGGYSEEDVKDGAPAIVLVPGY